MNRSKAGSFAPALNRLADLAKALSHPARLEILRTLAEKKACTCNELVGVLPLAQSTISQHLRELEQVGLIAGETQAPRSWYSLNRETVSELQILTSELVRTLENQR